MKRLLLVCASGFMLCTAWTQDSTTALYINTIIQKLEARLSADKIIRRDTIIYEEEGSNAKADPLRVSTSYYLNPETGGVDKIVEQSRYRQWTTNIEAIFHMDKPVRMTSTKWNGTNLILDFDLYFLFDNPVHFTRRVSVSGKPDGDFFLKWCRDLLAEFRSWQRTSGR